MNLDRDLIKKNFDNWLNYSDKLYKMLNEIKQESDKETLQNELKIFGNEFPNEITQRSKNKSNWIIGYYGKLNSQISCNLCKRQNSKYRLKGTTIHICNYCFGNYSDSIFDDVAFNDKEHVKQLLFNKYDKSNKM